MLVTTWVCPNCPQTFIARKFLPNRFHQCPGLRGLLAPMVPEGIKAKVEAHDRDDYVGRDIPAVDENGRPVMSVTTTRDDGQDTMVFAPTATARV